MRRGAGSTGPAATATAVAALLMACTAAHAEPAYEDRLIDPQQLGPADDGEGLLLDRYNAAGPPRSLSVEVRAQTEKIDANARVDTRWGVLRGTLETANHGFFTLDAAARLSGDRGDQATFDSSGASRRRSSFTLSQRRLPVGEGWLASNAVGLVQTGGVDLIAQQLRYGVPSRLVLGASTQWQHEGSGWVLQAAGGEPVALDAVGQSGYTGLGGRASVAALRWRGNGASERWSYALQAADFRASGRPFVPDPDLPGVTLPGLPSSQGVVQALRWQAPGAAAQFNLLSTRDRGRSLRTGGWLDATLDDGPVEHRLGLNDLAAEQQWLGTAVASGSRGGYYRWRWRSRQLLAEAQVDHQRFDAVGADLGAAPLRLTQGFGSLRYVLDQRSAAGLQSVLATSGGRQSASALGFYERFDAESSWRAFSGITHTEGEPPELQVGLDGASSWHTLRWNAGAALLQRRGDSPGSDLTLTLTSDLDQRTSFNLGARRFQASDAGSAGISLNATLQHRLAARWLLAAAYTESRGARVPQPFGPNVGAPPIDPDEAALRPRLRFAWISLRYDFSAGSRAVPLGGAAGGGGGQLDGVVFLDSNGNGLVDPGEPRLPNVTVVLDGRYGLRTDGQGRYEFAFVAPGDHTVEVIADDIPLPWSYGDSARKRVKVERRGSATLDLGALRQ